jgi:hypothetical protein
MIAWLLFAVFLCTTIFAGLKGMHHRGKAMSLANPNQQLSLHPSYQEPEHVNNMNNSNDPEVMRQLKLSNISSAVAVYSGVVALISLLSAGPIKISH